MPENINYKHLHYFWMVAHEGSIAQASKALHITPQTISGQLSLLEHRIGSPLFNKAGRGLALTDTGRLVLRYADDIFDLGRELSDVLRGVPSVGPLEFIVSASSALPKTIVHKIIEPVLHMKQPITLTCKEGPVADILAELAVHKVDMVLSDTPLNGELSVQAYNHKLGECGITFFVSPHLIQNYKPNFPASLDGAPMLLPTKQNAIRQQFDKWAEGKDITPIIKGQFDDSALMKSFGKEGAGIFFMPSVMTQEVCKTFNVKAIGQTREFTQSFYAISAERKIKHPAVSLICDAARESLFGI